MGDAVKLNERPVTTARAAEFTGYSKAHIYRLVHEGRIPYHKRGSAKGSGALRFYESELSRWMKDDWHFSPASGGLHETAERLLDGGSR